MQMKETYHTQSLNELNFYTKIAQSYNEETSSNV